MADKKTVFKCNGTIELKGEKMKCNKILAEIEHVNDARINIKCHKCGTMNVIEASTEKESTSSGVILNGHLQQFNLGTFGIQHISE